MQWLAAGIGAGLISGMGARSTQATNGDAVLAGQTVDATLPTAVRNSSSGITPDTTADGVQGYADGANNSGLFGRNNTTGGIGVAGAAPSGTGVFGESSNGYGVGAKSNSSYGLNAQSTSSHAVHAESATSYGVYGQSSGSGQPGVYGIGLSGGQGLFATASSNAGVYGQCTSSVFGVYGESATGTGVVGRTMANVANQSRAGLYLRKSRYHR